MVYFPIHPKNTKEPSISDTTKSAKNWASFENRTSPMARMGYEKEAFEIQDLFFEGKRDEAIARVPSSFADEISLVGPKERIIDRLQAWKQAGSKRHVRSMLIGGGSPEVLRTLAEEVL